MKLDRALPERERPEEKSWELLESVPDAMVIVNAEGTMRLVNSQTEKLFGYRREELLSQREKVLVPERFRTKHATHRVQYFRELRVRPMGAGLDLYGRRKDDTEGPVEISLSPLWTEGGLLVISAIRDITTRKQANEAGLRLVAIVASSDDAIMGGTDP